MLLDVESRGIQQSCQSRGSKPSPPFAIWERTLLSIGRCRNKRSGRNLVKGDPPNQALFKAVTHRAYLQKFTVRNEEYITSILISILIGFSGIFHGLAAPHNTSTEYRIGINRIARIPSSRRYVTSYGYGPGIDQASRCQ